jgi:hypothetical protein
VSLPLFLPGFQSHDSVKGTVLPTYQLCLSFCLCEPFPVSQVVLSVPVGNWYLVSEDKSLCERWTPSHRVLNTLPSGLQRGEAGKTGVLGAAPGLCGRGLS